jgi:Putative bacterial sensory transduction regulator
MDEMSENVPVSMELVGDALRALDWKYVQEEEGVGVSFQAAGVPTIHVGLKVAGARVVATSAIDVPVPRETWAEVLVDINQFNATHFRPKVYLSMPSDAETGMLIGEEVHDLSGGTTVELLGAWIGGHANAFATCASRILNVKLG